MKTLELNLPTPVLLVWGLPEGAINPVASMGYLIAQIPNPESFCHVDIMANPIKLEKWLKKQESVSEYNRFVWKIPEGNWQLIGKLSEWTDTEMLRSIADKGYYFTNPYGTDEPELEPECCGSPKQYRFDEPPECCGIPAPTEESIQVLQSWQDAQSKTLPANALIFKRA